MMSDFYWMLHIHTHTNKYLPDRSYLHPTTNLPTHQLWVFLGYYLLLCMGLFGGDDFIYILTSSGTYIMN